MGGRQHVTNAPKNPLDIEDNMSYFRNQDAASELRAFPSKLAHV
jgi:hypothetical protein